MPEYQLGEAFSPQWTRTRLCRLLRSYFEQKRAAADAGPLRVGTDVVFYYDPADRLARVTPDLYVLPGVGYEEQLRSFKVYERKRAPSLVFHIVDAPMTPEDGLMRHFLRLGCEDVVLYDPVWFLQPATAPKGRRLLCHYERQPSRTASGLDGPPVMRLQPLSHPGRVFLKRHGLWLVHRGGAELRIYADPRYTGAPDELPIEAALFPLPEERKHAH